MTTKNYTAFFTRLGLKAIIALGLVAGPLSGHAQCFTGWQYSQKVYINNANPSELDSFQVPLYINTAALVTATHMNADGSDIRFITSPGCCISLPYHIDSGMNSSMTKIWVKVPYLPASGNDTIIMLYGNAAATAASDPIATYDMWEPFDNQVNHFSEACNDGTGVMTVSGGQATFSWDTDAMWTSDSTFGMNHVYTADAWVTAVSGYWPELNWSKTDGVYSYFMPFAGFGGGSGTVYIGYSVDDGLGNCNGGYVPYSNSSSSDGTGLWSFTWVNTGDQEGTYRDLGTFSYTDANIAKDEPLKLGLGSIDGGTGSYTIDWVRVRKYAVSMPTGTYGTEASFASISTTISYTTPACKDSGATSTPTLTGAANGTYTVAPAGATINATTGVIDLGASTAGTYTVTYTAQGADTCSVIATATIVINAAIVPTVTAAGHVLTVTGTYATYQWYRDGTLVAGATTNPYTATQGGSYYVAVTDTNGCTAKSAIVIVSNVGVANVASIVDNINVFPNPNNGLFTIDGTAKADDNKATIEVTDVTGKVLMTTDTKIVNNAIHQEIQLNGKIPAGVYMLRITAGTEKKTVRLNVQ